MWVMPSSSARCAQLPRAADKVPFYVALKKFRDYLNGVIPHMDESECVFADPKSKACFGKKENDLHPYSKRHFHIPPIKLIYAVLYISLSLSVSSTSKR